MYHLISPSVIKVINLFGDRTVDPEKLTEDIVRSFIDKIVVHHRKVIDGVNVQKEEIIYNVIGKFEPPPIFAEQEQTATA